jgi:hypothetical protein
MVPSVPERKFAVVVDYGAASTARSRLEMSRMSARYDAQVIAVDTSIDLRLKGGRTVNSAFEFSGYQYGLDQVVDALAMGEGARIRVCFVNGTAFTSHLRQIVHHAVSQAFAGSTEMNERVRLSGLVHRCGDAKAAVATLGYYVPTFAFGLAGPARMLARVSLYNPDAVGRDALAQRYEAAGTAYESAIARWLSPLSLWGGWYKAIPGQPIDEETAYRKRLAIYLEHALPGWLAAQGVEVGGDASARGTLSRTVLMSADRLYTNVAKLKFRAEWWWRRKRPGGP